MSDNVLAEKVGDFWYPTFCGKYLSPYETKEEAEKASLEHLKKDSDTVVTFESVTEAERFYYWAERTFTCAMMWCKNRVIIHNKEATFEQMCSTIRGFKTAEKISLKEQR